MGKMRGQITVSEVQENNGKWNKQENIVRVLWEGKLVEEKEEQKENGDR